MLVRIVGLATALLWPAAGWASDVDAFTPVGATVYFHCEAWVHPAEGDAGRTGPDVYISELFEKPFSGSLESDLEPGGELYAEAESFGAYVTRRYGVTFGDGSNALYFCSGPYQDRRTIERGYMLGSYERNGWRVTHVRWTPPRR